MINSPQIWFVNRFFYPDHSATSQILSDLAFHLTERGFRVGVIASQGVYDDTTAHLPAHETCKGVDVHRVARARFGRASLAGRAVDYVGLYIAFARAAARLARAGDCLVVKTDPPMLSAAMAPVARLRRLRMVNWLQDVYPEVALGLGLDSLKPLAPALTAARDASLRAARQNVAIGDRMRNHLLRAGLTGERVAVIPNWCDDAAIRPCPAEENPLRRAWALEGRFVVGYSGNLGRAHEFGTLVAAAEILRHRHDIVFLFIGGGALAADLKREVATRGLEPNFRFLPYQDAALLPQSLTLPDVHWISLRPDMEGLIVPSKFYGVAAAGRPTIGVCDPEGELGALIRRHDCGESVAPGDGARLANIIGRLADDASLRARLGQNARVALDAHFSRRLCLQRWETLLTAVTGEPPPRLGR
jgi:glycosyltransferase involved in cell wall biosynthesis